MALMDEARGIASDLEDVVSRAGETVLDRGLGALITEVTDIGTRLSAFSDSIAAQMDEVMTRVRFESDEDAEDNGMPDWEADNLPLGAHIGRDSMDGEALQVGDRVQVYDSGRYGDPTAVVRGAGPDYGDGKARVHVALEDGRDNEYTPSTGRVRKLPAGENGAAAINVPESTVISSGTWVVDGKVWVIATHIRLAA